MAKKSVIYRNIRRQQLVEKKLAQRTELKKQWLNLKNDDEVRDVAFAKLQKMPRDSSPVRLRIRCALTGRPRGVFRRFGVSRSQLRNMAMNGEIPGMTKSSW